jgi:hypothetical protein
MNASGEVASVQIKVRDGLAVLQVGSGFELFMSGDEREVAPSNHRHRRGVVLEMDTRGITRYRLKNCVQSFGGIDAHQTVSRWAVLMVPDEACVVLDDGTLKRALRVQGYSEARWVMQTNLVRHERVQHDTVQAVFAVLPVGSAAELGPLDAHGPDYRLLVGDVQISSGPSLRSFPNWNPCTSSLTV